MVASPPHVIDHASLQQIKQVIQHHTEAETTEDDQSWNENIGAELVFNSSRCDT
jgi:hypothetical protein